MNLNKLKEILLIQIETLEKILSIEKNKHDILIEGKLVDFSTINQDLNTIITKMEDIENQRQSLLESFLSQSNSSSTSPKSITFADLLKAIKDSPEYEEMSALYTKIKDIVDQVKHWTSINKDLIEMALNVLNLSLFEDQKDIDYTGKTESNATNSMLINKII